MVGLSPLSTTSLVDASDIPLTTMTHKISKNRLAGRLLEEKKKRVNFPNTKPKISTRVGGSWFDDLEH